jgi:cytochrome P450
VTNLTAAPGFDRFDPTRWDGRRLRAADALPARELVSTFGHGRHACPAQRFSIAAIRTAVTRLLDGYDLMPRYREPQALRRQLGAVARPNGPCWVSYRTRRRDP